MCSSSWIFNIFNWSIKVMNSGNLDHSVNRFRVVMKDVLKYNVQEFQSKAQQSLKLGHWRSGSTLRQVSNAKPYIMTEIVGTRQDQRHENIFSFPLLIIRHMAESSKIILENKIRISSSKLIFFLKTSIYVILLRDSNQKYYIHYWFRKKNEN